MSDSKPKNGASHHGYGQPLGGGVQGGMPDDTIHLGELFQILLRHNRLIATVMVLVTALTVFWVGTRTPRYKASATLLLEQDESTGGVLSELASLTSDPAAEAEIALIRSRSLAEVTAAPPETWLTDVDLFDGTDADYDPVAAGDTTSMEGMGLETIVDAHDRRPSEGIMRRLTGERALDHRLRAWVQPVLGHEGDPELVRDLDVYFVDETTVRIAPHEGYLFGSDLESSTVGVEAVYAPDLELELFSLRLRLQASGAYAGQIYRVRLRSPEEAVLLLMEATGASESGRKTNVVNVTVEDSCPYRAAETANALAKNYIRRSVQIGRLKAERTLGFIKRQLEGQLESLKDAETVVADLQSQNPETISLTDSAKAVIDQLAALELQRTQLELSRTVLTQALSHLNAGDYEALARLGKETPNLLALGYIQELAALEAESLRLERTDVLGYKQLLQAEHLRLRALMEETALLIQSYELALAAIASGDQSAVARFASAPKGSSPGRDTEFEAYLNSLADLDAGLASAHAEFMPGNPELEKLEASRKILIATIAEQANGALAGSRATLRGYEALYADYSASIDDWPAAERGTIDGAVGTLRNRVRVTLTSQVSGLSDQISAIGAKISEQDRRLGELPQSQLALAQATRSLETHSEIVAFLLKSEQEAQITAAATSAAAVLIDPAVPPRSRSFPRATIFIALGMLLGLLLGSALAFVSHALRAALHSEAEVEQASGLPVIGSIPDFERGRTRIKGVKKGQRILPMRDDPDGPQAEAYRSIRAALRQALHGKNALKTLACTSCMKGEGKTVTNADLAIVFAKAGRKVLLVDCDLRKPQLHHLFAIDRGPGFAEVLESTASWRDCTQESGIENLTILPAGQTTTSPGELLASDRALATIDELKEAYDLVVFDLPPAVVVADVANFASNLDALLLIYRSGVVPGRVLTGAVTKLRQSEVNLLGVIINAVFVSRGTGGYGYGYGYGYGTASSRGRIQQQSGHDH
ncbi:MAG TPA: polysaccharide biosynthesis tyrosine autokinase [Planctomycetes bacterium]|nr:polysaccharide biosynthesis tyrosine autokinase [Planctomycetota bacterium]